MIAMALFTAALIMGSPDVFTIHAEVRDSVVLDASALHVREYLNDPQSFMRNLPGIVDVRKVAPTRSEWTYEVKPPLSSARRTTYAVNEHHAGPNAVIFETDQGSVDYMYCRAVIGDANDTSSLLTLELRLRSSREHGSDIHFLAPLFGEKFISDRMHDQLKSDITTFFNRIQHELRTVLTSQHQK